MKEKYLANQFKFRNLEDKNIPGSFLFVYS